MSLGIELAERGLLPDSLLRTGIRHMVRTRLRDERALQDRSRTRAQALGDAEARLRNESGAALAVDTDAANEQHYELSPEFFSTWLGPHLKYSCGFWDEEVSNLAQAEARALELSCQRAHIEDGQNVLDLGCGWGSLSIWIAERYPSSDVLAVSNSSLQREFIETRCVERDLRNLRVVTCDVNDLKLEAAFDRIVSVEMFEHVRNHRELLRRIATWLDPDGRLFVHVFRHRELAYPYADEGSGDWMARNFFSGGVMPSDQLLPSIDDALEVEARWQWDGTHYQKTCEAWLDRLDERREEATRILAGSCGERGAARAYQRWRMFLLACSELFGYAGGTEWGVSHYLMRRSDGPRTA
jgi:cyclopropane-fatty-acyl-phospholipid synthase